MKKLLISSLIVLLAMALLPQVAKAQFGKNLVVENVKWKIYESPHFKIYYYFPNKDDWAKEKEYIQDMVRWTETAYQEISATIDYEMPVNNKKHGKPRIFFFWNRYGFGHHTLGLGGIAYAEPHQMRMVCVSKEYPDAKTQQIVTHEVCHLFQFSLWRLAKKSPSGRIWRMLLTFIFEGWSQHVSGLHKTEPSALLTLRYWVLNDGLRYINIKDWVLRGISSAYPICYVLAGYFYDYLKETYGEDVLKSFVTEFRRAKPTTKGFEKIVFEVLKTDFAELDRGFRKWLEDQYKHFPIEKKEALEYGRDILVQRKLKERKGGSVYEAVLSPHDACENLIAGFIPRKDKIRVGLIHRITGRIFKNLTPGYSLYKHGLWPIIDLDGAGRALSFSPDGTSLLYFVQTVGKHPKLIILHDVSILSVSKKKAKIKTRKVEITLDDPESPEMSRDGKIVIFSAIRSGQRDIFSLNLETQEIQNLTNDKQFDYGPSFAPDEKTIVYAADVNGYKKLFSLNVETLEKKQLTFGTSNEIRPIYSRDGKIIWFISDQDKDKTKNIYSLDIANNQVTQWTNVLNSVRTVIPMEGKKLFFGAVGYRDSRHFFTDNLYEMDLGKTEPVATADKLLRPVPGQEAEEIYPTPLIENEEIDPEKIKKYKPHFYLAQGMFYGGADSRLGLYGYGHIHFTDLAFSKHIQASVMSFGKWYQRNSLTYFDLSRKLGWGAVLSNDDHYFYPWFVDWGFNPYGKPKIDPVLYNLRFKRTKLDLVTQYPLDLCHRLEFSLSSTSIKYAHPNWQLEADLLQGIDPEYAQQYGLRAAFLNRYINDGKFFSINFAFVRDTVRFKRNVGPFANDMYRVDLSLSTGGHNATISAEGKKYFRLGSECVFALRGYAGAQWGNTITPWIIGDLGELRGYGWMQFMGNRIWLANVELRFPLSKNFNLLGMYLGDIRAALFIDVAKIWFDDEKFNVLNQDDINLGLIKSSVGLDITLIQVPILGAPLHLTVCKRMKEFLKLEEKWQVKFYIGYSF